MFCVQKMMIMDPITRTSHQKSQASIEIHFARTKMSDNVFSFRSGIASEMEDRPETDDVPNKALFDDNRRLIFSDTVQQQLQAMQYFRKLLSVENEPPIDDVVGADLVPRFVQFLENDGQRELQFEAAWALTNIASGEARYAATLVEHGVIPIFVRLIRTGDLRIVEQSAWAIGNMVGENPDTRDLCLTEGVMPALVEAAGRVLPTQMGMVRNATWTISNLCRGKPKPSLALVSPAIPVLARLMRAANDDSIIADACWSLSYIADIAEEAVDMILATGIASHLVSLLRGSTPLIIQTAALRAVGNILSGNEDQTQQMIDAGVIPALSELLEMDRKTTRREVCWALSNIAGGNSQQVQALFDATPSVFPKVLEIVRTSAMDIRKEALWVVSNGLESCSWESILYLVDTLHVLRLLCELLSISNAAVLTATVQCMHKLLKRAAEKDQVARFIANLNAISAIENLQSHRSSEVRQVTLSLLQEFFTVE